MWSWLMMTAVKVAGAGIMPGITQVLAAAVGFEPTFHRLQYFLCVAVDDDRWCMMKYHDSVGTARLQTCYIQVRWQVAGVRAFTTAKV
jgi:hypothetical protein